MRYKQHGVKEKPQRPPGSDRVSSPIVAPGHLERVQAFLNTVDVKKAVDGLGTPRDLADWLTRHGLLAAGTQLTETDLRRAHTVRAGLHSLLLAHNGVDLAPEAVIEMDRAVLGARGQIRFDADGTPRYELGSREFDDALGTLVGFVHAAYCEGSWERLKACANSECRATFYDFTKTRRGKWCTKRCGDRIRARAQRRRDKYRS